MSRRHRLPGIDEENTTRRNVLTGSAYFLVAAGSLGAVSAGIKEDEPEFEIISIDVPDKATIGKAHTVEIRIVNIGDTSGTFRDTLEISLGDESSWQAVQDFVIEDVSPGEVVSSESDALVYDEATTIHVRIDGVVRSYELSIIEGGEGDLSAYTGELDYFGITTNAISGAQSIRATGPEHGSYRTIVSTSGLATYPRAGDTIRCSIAIDTDNTYGCVLWGVQSQSAPWPCYRLILDTGASPGIRFEKVPVDGPVESHNLPDSNRLSGGSYHDESTYVPTEGEVYTVEVDWQSNGSMPWSVTDSAGTTLAHDTSPILDTEYIGGGIGFMASRSWPEQSEVRVRFDNYELV